MGGGADFEALFSILLGSGLQGLANILPTQFQPCLEKQIDSLNKITKKKYSHRDSLICSTIVPMALSILPMT